MKEGQKEDDYEEPATHWTVQIRSRLAWRGLRMKRCSGSSGVRLRRRSKRVTLLSRKHSMWKLLYRVTYVSKFSYSMINTYKFRFQKLICGKLRTCETFLG